MLRKTAQLDFRAGMVPGVARDLIPDNGLYDAVNCLLDDDGAIYRRGGCEYHSNGAFGSAGLRMIWDGYLAAGQRTFLARSTSFGVLAADDQTVVDLGGSGLAGPVAAVEVGGLLFLGGGTIYGGSRKAADYSASTVSVTNGSKTVTGTGFTANVDAGMLLRVAGAGRYYAVASVDSNTSLTLADAYQGSTAAGQAYVLSRLGTAGLGTANPYALYGVAAKRLLGFTGSIIAFTPPGNPHSFDITGGDFHALPQGSNIIGGAGLQTDALVFATSGMWTISNMAFDLTDALGNVQQRLSHVAPNFILWGNAGIAEYSGSLIVPATDGVWMVGPGGPQEMISYSVAPLYLSYLRAGYTPGKAAVYRSHYLLPILDGSNNVVDLLVCRLDRPVWLGRHRPSIFPWTHWNGQAGQITAAAVRTNTAPTTPQLLGAERSSTSRVLKLGSCFEPTAGRKNDADGTTHQLDVTTKDYTTGPLNRNFVKKIRLRYELADAATDHPGVTAFYSVGNNTPDTTLWGTFLWGTGLWEDSSLSAFTNMAGIAPASNGRDPFVWRVSVKNRFIRFRFLSVNAAASLTLRWLEVFIRDAGRM